MKRMLSVLITFIVLLIGCVSQADATGLMPGTRFYVDPNGPAAKAARTAPPKEAKWLRIIGNRPGAHRFYMWNMPPDVAGVVSHYLAGTHDTVMLSTYSLVHGGCGFTATPAIQDQFDTFISGVAAGIGTHPVLFFLEPDALITAGCLSPAQLAIREAELSFAIAALKTNPNTMVYVDGGAADAVGVHREAGYLRDAGVGAADGFFLNATHFDWTSKEIRYGQQMARILGGKHFIVNTGTNGRGPLVPENRVKNGNEILCNPPGRGLGPLSLIHNVSQPTGYRYVDGFLWFHNPGGSGGACRPGAPPTGVFWPAYAEGLAKRWVHHVDRSH